MGVMRMPVGAAGKGCRFSRTPQMTERARGLRRSLGPIERRLWRYLRGAQLGVEFRRQHPVGPYVVDFYCAAVRLAIEVDGDEHANRQGRDARRTRYLNGKGIHVIRFTNRDVWTNCRGVCEFLALEIAHRVAMTPSRRAGRADLPLSGGGEGIV